MHERERDIADMNFAELEALRQRIGVSQARVCQMGNFNPATYTNWLRYARGRPGGSSPRASSLNVLRDVLRLALARHQAELEERAARCVRAA